jgi:hypothetical protein
MHVLDALQNRDNWPEASDVEPSSYLTVAHNPTLPSGSEESLETHRERKHSHPPLVIPEAAPYSGYPGPRSPKQGLAFWPLGPPDQVSGASRFARPG